MLTHEDRIFLQRVALQWDHICDTVSLVRLDGFLEDCRTNIVDHARCIRNALYDLLHIVSVPQLPLTNNHRILVWRVRGNINTYGNLQPYERNGYLPWNAMLAYNADTQTPVFDVDSLIQDLQKVCETIIPISILDGTPTGPATYDMD